MVLWLAWLNLVGLSYRSLQFRGHRTLNVWNNNIPESPLVCARSIGAAFSDHLMDHFVTRPSFCNPVKSLFFVQMIPILCRIQYIFVLVPKRVNEYKTENYFLIKKSRALRNGKPNLVHRNTSKSNRGVFFTLAYVSSVYSSTFLGLLMHVTKKLHACLWTISSSRTMRKSRDPNEMNQLSV